MNGLVDSITAFVFEKVPVLRLFDGYKRTIGNVLLVVAASLAAVHQQFPTLYPAGIETAIAYIGAVVRVFGDLHADAKQRK